MSNRRNQTSTLEREVRAVLSDAASDRNRSHSLLRGIERRCRRFLEEERWARITLRWAMVAGAVLAVLLLLDRGNEQEPAMTPDLLAVDVGEYFQKAPLEESQVLTAVIVGEAPQ